MPIIYLSPSTQEYNEYVSGGTEEQYMNLIADAMVPYLRSSGIRFSRNTPDMTAASSIRASNAGNYDLHLALHSNAAPPANAGNVRGADVYYYPTSVQGKRAADIIAHNLKYIYPLPELVKTIPTTTLGEVRSTRAPSVLIEFAYHDNPEDAAWIKNNIADIARNVVLSLTEFFDIPFIEATPQRNGTTLTSVPIHIKPDPDSTVLVTVPQGSQIVVNGEWNGWYVVDYNGVVGYADAMSIRISE